jgi:pimeloyl-ACP methyl ester carboxylesterase
MHRLGTALAVGAALCAVVTGVTRIARDAKRYRAASDLLYRRWTRIPAIAGPGTLRMHARLRDVMTQADPVVLVHGSGAGAAFLPLAARLSTRAPVYAPDLPGRGASDRDARALTADELARALGLWMDAMGLRRAVMVGHGNGCQVVVRAVSDHPELASRVVLVAPAHRIEAGTVLPRRVACPVTFVRGERDRFVRGHWAQRLARVSGGDETIAVPGWGHAAHHEDPARVADLIVRYAASERPAAGA